MPSSTTSALSNSDLQFSSDPNHWLYGQHACGPVNPFESVYSSDYYIIDKRSPPKKENKIYSYIKRVFKVGHHRSRSHM